MSHCCCWVFFVARGNDEISSGRHFRLTDRRERATSDSKMGQKVVVVKIKFFSLFQFFLSRQTCWSPLLTLPTWQLIRMMAWVEESIGGLTASENKKWIGSRWVGRSIMRKTSSYLCRSAGNICWSNWSVFFRSKLFCIKITFSRSLVDRIEQIFRAFKIGAEKVVLVHL